MSTTATFQQGTAGYTGCQDNWISVFDTGNYNWGGNAGALVGFETGFGNEKILMRFDLSSIASTSTVISANLQLYDEDYASRNQNTPVDIYQVATANAAWTPGAGDGLNPAAAGTSCWNFRAYNTNAWAGSAGLSTATTDYVNTSLGQYTFLDGGSGFKQIDFNASGIAYIQTLLGGTGGGGFLIQTSTPTTNNCLTKTTGADGATTANRPILTIVYSAIKSINGLAYGSVKTVNGLAIASVKTVNGL